MPLLHKAVPRYFHQERGDPQVLSVHGVRASSIDDIMDGVVRVRGRFTMQTAGAMEPHGKCLC